jgi:hypothetical protein
MRERRIKASSLYSVGCAQTICTYLQWSRTFVYAFSTRRLYIYIYLYVIIYIVPYNIINLFDPQPSTPYQHNREPWLTTTTTTMVTTNHTRQP